MIEMEYFHCHLHHRDVDEVHLRPLLAQGPHQLVALGSVNISVRILASGTLTYSGCMIVILAAAFEQL
jgi:hypothetical protein